MELIHCYDYFFCFQFMGLKWKSVAFEIDLTLKRLVHFFQNVILFSNLVHHKCNIFYMKLVQCNECLISIVDADGLVL